MLSGYHPRLEAISSDGLILNILPLSEMAIILKLDENSIRDDIASSLGISINELPHNICYIELPDRQDKYKNNNNTGHYEEITITWLEPISEQQYYNVLTKYLKIDTLFYKFGNSSLYLDFEVGEKYQFYGKPKLYGETFETYGFNNEHSVPTYPELSNDDFETILDDKRHFVFRFDRSFNAMLRLMLKIGVSKMVRVWSWLGLSLGIVLIPYLLYSINNNYLTIFPIGLGIIGILIGFRILLLHDIELLSRWNIVYIIIVIFDISILIYTGSFIHFNLNQT